MFAEGSKEPETDTPRHEKQGPAGESVDEARREIRREIESLPDVRGEMVDVVQQRIRDGFYDRPEILEEIVDRLLRCSPNESPDTPARGEP